MRKRLIVQVVTAMSLMAALLAGHPGAAFAHGQSPGASTKSFAATLGGASTDQLSLRNVATGRCMDDSLAYGLRANNCNNLDYQRFFITSNDGGGTWVLQNVHTGSCLDDSAAYGLRGYYCNNLDYQQFFLTTHDNGYSWVLQNVHTGSCVDDSFAYGLRGYYCNNLNYQRWIIGA
jgi:hypothetical protein